MKKRVVDFVKLKNHVDLSINNSALIGLRRYNRLLRYFLYGVSVLGGGALIINYKLSQIKETVTTKRRLFLEKLDNNPAIENIFLKAHKHLFIEYSSNYEFDHYENLAQITDYRSKLLKQWANGLVLETCKFLIKQVAALLGMENIMIGTK